MSIDLSGHESAAFAAGAKDFSYDSGERQTAIRFSDIRRDHASRYELAALILKNHFAGAAAPLRGVDLFCGNGYGSWFVSRELGAHLLGIDGSEDAIRVAGENYATSRTIFSAKRFPFELPEAAFDFALCFESIEHVAAPEALFLALARGLRPGGVLFVSTPSEAVMPLERNAHWFRHHVRHFYDAELPAFARALGWLDFAGGFGQDVYRLDETGRVLGLDEHAGMEPVADHPAPQFFIQMFMRIDGAGPRAGAADRDA